jgi:hypothetical protein
VVVNNPLKETSTGYEMDLEHLRQVVETERPKMMILCNPHNPVGIQWSAEVMCEVAKICRANDVIVVSDEIHGDLMLYGKPHIPFASVSDDAKAVAITLGAPSKSFNIPGLVSSWMVIKNEKLREPFFQWMSTNEFSSPTMFATIGAEVAYAYGEKPSVFDHMTTDEWCEKFNVEKCETIEELCEKSDVLLMLAPSNPEKHLEYAKKVLPFGKPTYIDKTFAPNFLEAKEIFALSEKYNAPIFSTSALRYGDEIKDVSAKSIITTGGGSNLPEYIIHQAEMVIKTLNAEPESAKAENLDGKYIISADFEGGKKATMIYANPLPFTVCITKEDGGEFYSEMKSPFFKSKSRFFKTRWPLIYAK